jgi:hypothetical protein
MRRPLTAVAGPIRQGHLHRQQHMPLRRRVRGRELRSVAGDFGVSVQLLVAGLMQRE